MSPISPLTTSMNGHTLMHFLTTFCACCHQRMQCRQITKDAVRCNSGFDRREWTQRRATTADTDEPTTDNTYAIRTDHDKRELDKEEIQLMTYKSYLERRVAY
eukprot:957582_1